MVAFQTITNPLVLVNDALVAIKPNTFKFTQGQGENMTESLSAGGDTVAVVQCQNLENRFTQGSMELPVTPEHIAFARQWKRNFNRNAMSATDSGAGGSWIFRNMMITNDFETTFGAGEYFTVEFHSDPVVFT